MKGSVRRWLRSKTMHLKVTQTVNSFLRCGWPWLIPAWHETNHSTEIKIQILRSPFVPIPSTRGILLMFVRLSETGLHCGQGQVRIACDAGASRHIKLSPTILISSRYGIKPLFWTVAEGRLLVAAEMKAFKPIHGATFEWDLRSIADGSYNFGCNTTFKNIEKV
jgi:hypothetical protein